MRKHHMTPQTPGPGQFQSKDPAKNMSIAEFRTAQTQWFALAGLELDGIKLQSENNQGQPDGNDEDGLAQYGDYGKALDVWADKYGLQRLNIVVQLLPLGESAGKNWENAAQFQAGFKQAVDSDGSDNVDVRSGAMAQFLRQHFPEINLGSLFSEMDE